MAPGTLHLGAVNIGAFMRRAHNIPQHLKHYVL